MFKGDISMRLLHRILTGLLAIALLAVTPLVMPGTASAALPKRTVSSDVADTSNRLYFKGNVSPGHADKPVFIQKKNCKRERCEWHLFTKVRANAKGGFRARISAPKDGYWYWRAKVRKHGGYGTSYSEVWRTYTI